MSLKINTKKFQKISSTPEHTIMQDDKGHELKILHKPLHPKMRAQLEALPTKELKEKKPSHSNKDKSIAMMSKGGEIQDPTQQHLMQGDEQPNKIEKDVVSHTEERMHKMADGGEVADSQQSSQEQPPQQAPVVVNVNSNPLQGAMGPTGAPPQGLQGIPDQTQSIIPPAQQPQLQNIPQQQTASQPVQQTVKSQEQPQQNINDPYGTGLTQQVFESGLQEKKAGLLGQSQAEQQQGQAQSAALQQSLKAQQQIQQSYQKHYSDLDKERMSFQQDIQNQHIDPNHYFDSKSTGGKIATAIGLILGGIGGGLTHQENPALKMLQMNIERDINAQKANLGKSENLLNANYRQFGNMHDAVNMTHIMQNDIVSNQLKQAAAQAATPAAKAAALKAVGELDMDSSQRQGVMTARKTLLGAANAGAIPPERVVELLVPDAEKKDAYKELQDAQNAVQLRDNTLSAFDQIVELNTLANRASNPLQSHRQIEAIGGATLDKLTKDTSGRVTPQTVDLIKTLLPRLGNSEKTNQIARQKMNDLLSQGMHFPKLKFYGINPESMGRNNSIGGKIIPESAPIVPTK